MRPRRDQDGGRARPADHQLAFEGPSASFSSRAVPTRGYHDGAMSLLTQKSSSSNGSGPGEELTKGSGHILWAAAAAALVVSAAITLYFVAGQKPPAVKGEITRATAQFMHRETAESDANGAPIPVQQFDQVLLFTRIKLQNQSKDPLFLRQILANVTLQDGIHSSYAAPPTDYERLFVAYPELAALHGKPFAIEETIQPGETLEGDFVSSFRMTKAEWQSRKSLDYSVSLRYQPDLRLPPPAQVTEQ